jgi:hypothetical protein
LVFNGISYKTPPFVCILQPGRKNSGNGRRIALTEKDCIGELLLSHELFDIANELCGDDVLSPQYP